jgi:hypothetical protein
VICKYVKLLSCKRDDNIQQAYSLLIENEFYAHFEIIRTCFTIFLC